MINKIGVHRWLVPEVLQKLFLNVLEIFYWVIREIFLLVLLFQKLGAMPIGEGQLSQCLYGSYAFASTYKGHYPTVTHQLEEFLYILKEHVENNSFVKYYVRMANFNKVIKV